MTKSIAVLTTGSALAAANALFAENGWGADNFLVSLSASGDAPPTHFGLRASVNSGFASGLADAVAADTELSAHITVDVRADTDRQGHFAALLHAAGLQRIEPQPEG